MLRGQGGSSPRELLGWNCTVTSAFIAKIVAVCPLSSGRQGVDARLIQNTRGNRPCI